MVFGGISGDQREILREDSKVKKFLIQTGEEKGRNRRKNVEVEDERWGVHAMPWGPHDPCDYSVSFDDPRSQRARFASQIAADMTRCQNYLTAFLHETPANLLVNHQN